MKRTPPPYDDKWAIARLREVWEWAVATNRHFVAYLLGMAILAFELDTGDRKFKPSQPRAADMAEHHAQTKNK
jgi:hypothetical protein